MKTKKEIIGKVGLLAAAHIREPEEKREELVSRCIEELKNRNFEIIFSGKIVHSQSEVLENIRKFRRENVEAVIFIPTNWLEPPMIVHPMQSIKDLPLLIWGFPETTELLEGGLLLGSASTSAVVKSALEQMGWQFGYVIGMPQWKDAVDEVERYLKVVLVSKKIRMSTIGLVGYESMGIYTATFDGLSLKKVFGIEVDSAADSYILVEEMKKISPDEILSVESRLKNTCEVKDEIIQDKSFEKSIIMYLALKKMIKNRNWKALSVKCQHELTSYLKCSACLPLSMITDEGIMGSCEGDIHAALTTLIMHCFSKAKIFCGDIFPYNRKSFLMSHGGFLPHSCRKEGTSVILNPQSPRLSKDGKATGGVVSTLTFEQSDKVTLARIEGRREGGYKMHIVTGKVKPIESIPDSSAEIELDSNAQMFIQNQLSNHYTMIWEDIKSDLESFCRYKNIEIIR